MRHILFPAIFCFAGTSLFHDRGSCDAFTINGGLDTKKTSTSLLASKTNGIDQIHDVSQTSDNLSLMNRRALLNRAITASSVLASSTLVFTPSSAHADDESAVSATATMVPPQIPSNETPMKNFIDPVGYFTIRVPQNFYTLRRSAKGDLPDAKTGSGRRGSSIFTAGNMAKAEVIAIERFPTRVLLEENGIEAIGDLSTITALGNPATVATLINLRREKDKPGSFNKPTQIIPNSLLLSNDGTEMYYQLRSEIDVQKPELLMETYGVSRLFRVTTAKVSLKSKDGNIMAVFASALETDFNGPDGIALQDSVNSFNVIEQA